MPRRIIWLTVKEFAYLAKRNEEVIETMCRKKKLRAEKFCGAWLIHEKELKKFGGWLKWLDQ